jgi:hypothetical protein
MGPVGPLAVNRSTWARLDLVGEKAELFALQQSWAPKRPEID